MTQPTERRFVMEPRLDAEVETLNDAIDAEETARIAGDALKVAKAGDTMTGALTLNADPTNNLHAATKQYVDNVTINTDNLGDIDYIQFDTTYDGGSTAAGMLAWDQANETLQFMVDDHVTLQVGQEHLLRVKNNSGSVAIPDRTVVMFAGANGDTIKVAPAVSDGTVNVNYLAGITTEEIPADGFGFVTQLGFVNHVNTNLWPVGTLLYSDPATPGGLTATEPESPAWTMPVAAVTKQNASAGRMLVRAIPGGSGAGGGASVNISDTAPVGGNPGDMWYDSTDGTLYVYYEDVDGSQWVQVQANSALTAGIESRVGALESQAIALGAYSPNYLINGDFTINQRNFSSSTTSGSFIADRWFFNGTVGTTGSRQAFTPGTAPVSGYESEAFARIVTTGQTGTSIRTDLIQRIEDVRTLAGKTVTVSFWAKAGSGTPSVSLEFAASYGTGGSPSAVETGIGVNKILLSGGTAWTRYSATVTMPSLAGKTLGTTANTSYWSMSLWTSAGTDFNSRTDSLGIQSNTFDFWGVQVEQGSTATAFRRNGNSIQEELANCQRYFFRAMATALYGFIASGFQSTTTGITATRYLPVTMRAVPSVAGTSVEWSDDVNFSVGMTGLAVTAGSDPTMARMTATIAANGSSLRPGVIRAATTTGYLDFSAEL